MEGPVRVLHAVVNMNRGGAETLIMNLYRNIDRDRVQFDFLTSKPGVFDEEIADMGGIVHRISHITDNGHRSYSRELRGFFENHRHYRTVHSHMDKMSGLVLFAAKKAGIPIRIAHSHNTMSEGGYAARLYKWYVGNRIASSATVRMACSTAAAAWLFPNKAGDTLILKNGIESGRFAFQEEVREQVRAELEISAQTFAVGHVGRFLHQKNHAYLIDRFAELLTRHEDSVLVLAGDGPLRSQIEQKVRDYGIQSKIRFLGVRSDVDRLMQGFDVFVFPSFHEGLPVTLVEAQGAGLPCVISDSITNEVDMGLGLIHSFPLDSKEKCQSKLLDIARQRSSRSIPPDALIRKGYDIAQTARWAEQFYRT
ncbi:Glycosyltransferase involved in cell wall bisynthesis [Cohnella sp. OV330]|uniref:glycosyltransferase family 1 protein n=1 Tax=Cohnella sp. OV330 TaxID=1855288 RepID=UPI0008E81440|nr:glycosyltransferase family 1 protein [Cohnella sp. OV330]SFB30016.1 Glycosyltransferase involved in cell wall bisynthesis [Cohnella sp. OV330]